ncbi:MAG: transcription antitermination factor NusB [Deltaproteobacteria bacterium RIFCSPLOWO2_12_FULL_40_28]|nr:MAG: transcription antitermination factor NusB [Deltaproteobacteria bacterium RIFCSPHIGHO2_02_FULL_40_28]OGQ19649.1 MAG: transcription antitermination factor NusB [Deltaproteobacteria bacterium RIFCSPHIGHO2_12_FULL_40_32]OGQ40926.1 MAG: transcription antitermination factor NusB [Deltaproteobacteria bacterium RIFCSPLOWO2_02_FULL_40_36]OGQ54041.1 MAG: transcription antitermination factor NusB [Deltaproteobacteria bacterium RIFCSPLOWO2_12_FULL_40_28]
MGNRRKARECGLQILYQIDFTSRKLQEVATVYWTDHPEVEEVATYCHSLLEGTLRNLPEIDMIIEEASTNWKMSRMAAVDRNILRQATYELIYQTDIPASVIINEAIEISKKYGTEESPSFINGILDKIAKIKRL